MEILFEEVVEAMPWYGCLGIALIVSVFTFLFGLCMTDGETILTVVLSILVCAITFALMYFAQEDTHTLYTVRVTDDSGYRLMVENYNIEEQKSNDIYVVKEK